MYISTLNIVLVSKKYLKVVSVLPSRNHKKLASLTRNFLENAYKMVSAGHGPCTMHVDMCMCDANYCSFKRLMNKVCYTYFLSLGVLKYIATCTQQSEYTCSI